MATFGQCANREPHETHVHNSATLGAYICIGYWVIVDLSDDRRANKPWLPEDDRDVTNDLVVKGSDGKPSCVLHGAMSRVDRFAGYYRCSEQRCGVGAELVRAPKENQ